MRYGQCEVSVKFLWHWPIYRLQGAVSLYCSRLSVTVCVICYKKLIQPETTLTPSVGLGCVRLGQVRLV